MSEDTRSKRALAAVPQNQPVTLRRTPVLDQAPDTACDAEDTAPRCDPRDDGVLPSLLAVNFARSLFQPRSEAAANQQQDAGPRGHIGG